MMVATRSMKRIGNSKRQKAGKKSSLHSPKKAIRLSDIENRGTVGVTHDYSHVYGWNRKV